MANDRPAQQNEIKLLISKGLEQGYLTYAEVNDALPDDIVDPEQIEDIIGMINGMGIDVHEVAPDAETLLAVEGMTASAYAARTGDKRWQVRLALDGQAVKVVASPDGKTITLKGSHPEPDGGKMTHRAVWKIVDSNTQTFDMYGAHKGDKETKMLEIVYSRKQ